MSKNEPTQGWLPGFRRATGYLRPHGRTLLIGLVAAVGVGVFYTFSVSSIVPVLKVIFAEHETLVDWLNRAEAQRRLGVTIPADLPDSPDGLRITGVAKTSANADVLSPGTRIIGIDGESGSSYELAERIAEYDGSTIPGVQLSGTPPDEAATLAVGRPAWWWPPAQAIASQLPQAPTPSGRFRTLLIVMSAFVVISLLGGVCRLFNEGCIAIAIQRAMHDLRTELAAHTLRMPLEWHSRQPAGDTLARFSNDIDKVRVGLSTLFGKTVREPLKAIGVISLAAVIDWRMLLIAVVGLPLGILAIRTFGRLVKREQRRASQSWGRLLDHLGERITGIRVVKACNMQAAESGRFADEDQELTRAQTRIEMVDAAAKPVLEILASLAISAFILYGGYRVFHRDLEPHMFFGAVICLGGIFDPLRKMGNVNNRLQAAEASAHRLFELLNMPAEEAAEAPAAAKSLDRLRERIEFNGVSFAYPSHPQRYVLDDINLTVDRGQIVAIVGGNGSGKTTLMSLLMRFFEPTRGQICIDGQDIREVSLQSLRSQIGLVTQEAIIFSDTLRGNITYGANGVAEEDILRAAKLAHVDEFARPLRVEHAGEVTTGYDAQVNARTLSGGQRQRIVLARAILRDPPILILDEATSQVDTESEQKIQQALDDVIRDRTTFIIAHRFSTIARADLTVVLHEGRVVGLGRHDDLVKTCPHYDALVKTQFVGKV